MTSDGRLNGTYYMRSSDSVAGRGWNDFEAALLLRMLAHVTGLRPGTLTWFGGDVHVYRNHFEAVAEQVRRQPRPYPTLRIVNERSSIDDFEEGDFELDGYDPHPRIEIEIAV